MNLRNLLPGILLLSLPLWAACNRTESTARDTPSPSASVVTIGVALGTCEDIGLCERECDGGSADRCRRLAASYAFGQGVEKDEARATALYARACDMNDAPGCVFAGQMNEYAHGVNPDAGAAAAFYDRACELDWPAGCYNLAIMFESGRGVPPDRAKAGELYRAACASGAKPACDKAKRLQAATD